MLRMTTLLTLLTLTVCPEQQSKDPATAPFLIDASKLAVDPESGQKLFLGWGIVEVGRTAVWDANYCDPDNDPVTIAFEGIAGAVVTTDANDIAVTFKLTAPGVYYGILTATDRPGEYATPKVRKATFVVAGVPGNRPPNIGCGSLRR